MYIMVFQYTAADLDPGLHVEAWNYKNLYSRYLLWDSVKYLDTTLLQGFYFL